jgi:hypothetical protein
MHEPRAGVKEVVARCGDDDLVAAVLFGAMRDGRHERPDAPLHRIFGAGIFEDAPGAPERRLRVRLLQRALSRTAAYRTACNARADWPTGTRRFSMLGDPQDRRLDRLRPGVRIG